MIPTDRAAWVLGVDIGGTRTKCCLINRLDSTRVTQDLETGTREPDTLCEAIIACTGQLLERVNATAEHIAGAGLACPGPLDLKRGVVTKAANLPGWIDVPIRDTFAHRSGWPTVLLNDANAACCGEALFGAGRGMSTVVLSTLGTGVGGGMSIDGRLLQGTRGNAGELGHLIVVPEGLPCSCGQKGCLESYAGGRSIVRRAVDAGVFSDGNPGTVEDVVDAARQDERARKIWDDACRALALACVSMQHVLEPDVFIFGGGIAASGDKLLTPIEAAVKNAFWTLDPAFATLRLAELGTWAGAIGAAASFDRARAMRDGD